jgi:regulator of sigma E protease
MIEETTMVFGVLGKLGTQISPRELSGPWGILQAASRAAQESVTRLLLFLCMISANLAVINFLPIPLLDGGHMVFLAYEGIRGRPASERVQLVLTYVGLIFLLTLMAWVLGLDFHLISRD